MTEEKKTDDRGFDSYIPMWDGRVDSLRDFRKQVELWFANIDLEKTTTFNLAARFAMRQRGAAKLRALEFDPKDLSYTPEYAMPDAATGDTTTIPAKYDTGIKKILAAWEDMVGRSVSDRKGELREPFYLSMRRGQAENVPNFARATGPWWLR